MDPDDIFLCHQCGKVFYKLSTFESHTKWKHMEKTNDFMCDQCGRTFQKRYNLVKHLESGIHDISETVKCAICDFRALNRRIMGEHYQKYHRVSLKETDLYFNTADEFYTWKSDFETKTRSRFVKMSSSRRRKNGFIRSTYFCHRDGNFISKGRNIRHLKVKGSNKINAHCPAKMEVDFGEKIVIVSYIGTHLGHELDVSRLSLDQGDRALIAQKLALKVPFEQILDEINNSVKDGEVKRVNLLTRKDLWNIVDAFKINPKNVVYSKARVRRKRKLVQPNREQRKNPPLFIKSINKSATSSNSQVVGSVEKEELYAGDQIVSVKQENEENVILCPVIVKEENNEYIQEYTLVADENDTNSGTFLIINANGELESISGHRVIYTDEGDIEICDSTDANCEEQVQKDEQSDISTNQAVCYVSKTPTLDQGMVVDSNDTFLLNDTVFIKENDYDIQNRRLFEVNNTEEESDSQIISDSDAGMIINEQTDVHGSEFQVLETDPVQSDEGSENIHIKKEEGTGEVMLLSNNSNRYFTQSSSVPIESITDVEVNPEYEVTIADFDGEEGNEYVIISTEDLDECTVISAENSAPDSAIKEPDVKTHKEVVMEEADSKEQINCVGLGEDECTDVEIYEEEPKWNEQRKKMLNKLLNVHSMINNEQQLKVFSKKISSLEHVLKSLSNSDELTNLSEHQCKSDEQSSSNYGTGR